VATLTRGGKSVVDPLSAQHNKSGAGDSMPTEVEQAFALGWHVAELYHMESNAGAAVGRQKCIAHAALA
jgi:hypothetical protein